MFKQVFLLCVAVLPACGGSSVTIAPAVQTAGQKDRERDQLFQLGQQAAERGDSVRAEQYLSWALERGYPEARVLPLLLRVCVRGSRLRAALDHAEPYLREHPDEDALRLLVASIHVGLAQPKQALAELDVLLRHTPTFAEALFLRATLNAPETDAARADLRGYLDVAPQGPHAAEVRSRLAELALLEPSSVAPTSQVTP
jgi:tetratricopeptide (TPR) repeat protein